MINSFLKNRYGAVTLVFTVILLVLSTLIILFAANTGLTLSKIVANANRASQAFSAAEAGMEFGINYLLKNRSTVLVSASGGYINYTDSSLTNISLANNSKFSVVYTNPVANDFNLILVTSTGASDDASATKIVSQLVQFGSLLSNLPTNTLTSLERIMVGGTSIIANLESNTTITSGEDVILFGSSYTLLNSGVSSTPGNIKSDVQQNVSSLESMSKSNFFSSYFAAPSSTVKTKTDYFYASSSDKNYSTELNNTSGVSIWIDQTGGTAVISGTTNIGTAENPVLLVVSGDLFLSGNISFYGLLFVTGKSTQDSSGHLILNGALLTSDDFLGFGEVLIYFDTSLLEKIQNQTGIGYFAKIQGSWSDF